MKTQLHFAGISGSLRKGSFNTMLLNAAAGLLPEDVTIEIVSIADIPNYNADLDVPAAKQRPEVVQSFRDTLARADGLVIVSPEYNYSIPGGLKNAIDWASRGQDSPLLHMPVAVMGAAPGMWGHCPNANGFLRSISFFGHETCFETRSTCGKSCRKI